MPSDDQILKAYKKYSSKSEAARKLGLPRTTFRNRLNKILNGKEKQKEKPVNLLLAKPDSELVIKKKTSRYVITCAQNNTDIFQPFYKNLLKYCEVNKAQLIVIPIRYKNVNAYCPTDQYHVKWPQELKPYFLNDRLELNDNLVVLGDLKINATSSDPLRSINSFSGKKSAIIGHAQLAMKMIASPQYELPKQLLTTGSISQKNYSKSQIGALAEFNHTYGASVVEVCGDKFFTRQINALDDGSFCDLLTEYKNGEVEHYDRVEALVLGDLHGIRMDQDVIKTTFEGDNSIVNYLKPKKIVCHDVIDFYNQNHHNKGNIFLEYAKYHGKQNNVEEELKNFADFHNKYFSKTDTEYYYISSNHHDAFTRWLMECDPKKDPENALFYHYTMYNLLKNTRWDHKNGDPILMNPFKFFMEQHVSNWENTHFVGRNSKLEIKGIDCSQHGDKGINGTRASGSSFSKTCYKMIIGHGHSPFICKGVYGVGTNSRLFMGYNSGYSSWMHTDCVIYRNGKRSLLNIIKGEWFKPPNE